MMVVKMNGQDGIIRKTRRKQSMRTLVCFGLVLAFAGSARAYVSVDADASVKVENRITRLDIDQEIGSERIECGGGLVSVVRIVKTKAYASAEAGARASCDARARYSDSCSCSGGGSCSTSGSGSDSDSASKSDLVSSDRLEEVKFTVARVSVDKLLQKGFSVAPAACVIADPAGIPLNPLGAIAVVTWLYGEQLIAENPLAIRAVRNLFSDLVPATPAAPVLPAPQPPAESLKRRVSFERLDGGTVK